MASIDDVQDSLDKLMRQIFESAHGHLRVIEVVSNSSPKDSSSSSSIQQSETIQNLANEKAEELQATIQEIRNQINTLHGIDVSKEALDTKIDKINNEYRVLRTEILELDSKLDQTAQEIDEYLEQV